MLARVSKNTARFGDRARGLVTVATVALVALFPGATAAGDRVAFTLSSTVMSVFGELHATVKVDPQDENRVLRVSLDGPLYYASTDVQLDGAGAARIHDIWWRFLPPGEYAVTATLECASGRRFVQSQHLRVIGGSADLADTDPSNP